MLFRSSLGKITINTGLNTNQEVKILIRPESLNLSKNPSGTGSIQDIVFAGSKKNITVLLDSGEIIRVYADKAIELEKGSKVNISFNPQDLRVFKK